MRAIRRLAVAVLLLAATIGLGAEPASAHSVDFCSGSGTMVTTSDVYYAGFGLPATFNYSITLTIGGCVLGHSATASGTMVAGYCGLAVGSVNWDGHVGIAIWSGGSIEFHGQVEGSLAVTPDALNGESCVSGADHFLVNGGVFLHTV